MLKSQTLYHVKARSHDPFLRIRFLVPKTESRRSYGPISRFRFCGENVGRSFVVCSHDPLFSTNKESSIWRQHDHAKFVGAFRPSRRVSDENRVSSICIRFFKITDLFDGRSFLMCSHDPFFGTNKNRILKNGSCEQAFKLPKFHQKKRCGQYRRGRSIQARQLVFQSYYRLLAYQFSNGISLRPFWCHAPSPRSSVRDTQ